MNENLFKIRTFTSVGYKPLIDFTSVLLVETARKERPER
jgi:hypothetical protein